MGTRNLQVSEFSEVFSEFSEVFSELSEVFSELSEGFSELSADCGLWASGSAPSSRHGLIASLGLCRPPLP